jgi:16S rRNA (cytosine967-C5)-methyltransferase
LKSKTHKSRGAVSPARASAFDILLRVERESSYASELLHSRNYLSLSEADHALATELVMGVLRWRSRLDAEIARHSAQPLTKLDLEILVALRLAVYQLNWLDRIPERAAIHESVEMVKRARKSSAAGFVNAVLRKIASSPLESVSSANGENAQSAESVAAITAHPEWLVERWIQAYGLEAVRKICDYDQSIPHTTIRLRAADAEKQLSEEGIELAAGALLASARMVCRGDVTRTEAFRNGLCAIQDEASQLVAALVGLGSKILDCCAAPGGKTLSIADRNSAAEIVAVDVHLHRARLLRRMLGKQKPDANSRGVKIVSADARSLPFVLKFDRVLADVPCSGTGTLARNPEIKWRLKPEGLTDLQARQMAILSAAMKQVAVGGRLIYSTCSLEKEENEDVIEQVLARNASFRLLDCKHELARLKREGELALPELDSLTQGPFLRTRDFSPQSSKESQRRGF